MKPWRWFFSGAAGATITQIIWPDMSFVLYVIMSLIIANLVLVFMDFAVQVRDLMRAHREFKHSQQWTEDQL